jgi:hypothetical protein
LGHLIEDRALGPGGLAQHVLQGLMVRVGNHLFHPFHVLGFRLDQTTDILLGRGLNRSRPLVEVIRKAITEIHEPLTHSGQQPHRSASDRVFFTAPERVSCMFYLIKPCLLTRAILSLLINKIQIHKSDKVELNNTVKIPQKTTKILWYLMH